MKTVVLLVFVVSLCTLPQQANAAPNSAQAVYTNKTQFRIPYRYDAEEIRRLNAKEIRLYVSRNFGSQWQHVASVEPVAERFQFKASEDGEYWFAVRTLDGNGRLHPKSATIEAGLKVVVDTLVPQFEVSLRQTSPGKIEMQWSASDPYLDPTTLRLEYFQTGSTDWQTVSVSPQANGKTSWSVTEGGVVAVRGAISDKSQNTARSQAQATIDQVDQAAPFHHPVAQGDNPTNSMAVLPQQFPQHETHRADPLLTDPFAAAGLDTKRAIINPAPTNRLVSSGSTGSTRTLPQFPSTPKSLELPQAKTVNTKRPPGRSRAVRSRKFNIEYRIDVLGPSGVSRVELFITQDGGKKWWKYGDDPDRQSPFHVEVPGDGSYGFELRVHSGAGLSDDPPQPFDEPSILIVVDQSPPVVQMMPPQQGVGPDLNKVLIRWKVSDQSLAESPVFLSYSASTEGPWQPVSGWLPDTGSYLWTVSSGVPSRIYIRLTVRDSAGNMTRTETTQPVLFDLKKPLARIVDVQVSDAQN